MKVSSRSYLTFLAALELVHLASLIHDDILDSTEVRRNGITVSRLFSSQEAALTGDMIFSAAMSMVSMCRIPAVERAFHEKTASMCRAEIDQDFSQRITDAPEREVLRRIARDKTGALFALAASIPALIEMPRSATAQALEECGYICGELYQLRDDLADVCHDTRGSDGSFRHWTFVSRLWAESDPSGFQKFLSGEVSGMSQKAKTTVHSAVDREVNLLRERLMEQCTALPVCLQRTVLRYFRRFGTVQ